MQTWEVIMVKDGIMNLQNIIWEEEKMEKEFRVGAEATFVECKGEIPVAAAASKPLMSNHAAATKKIIRKEHHARTYYKLLF